MIYDNGWIAQFPTKGKEGPEEEWDFKDQRNPESRILDTRMSWIIFCEKLKYCFRACYQTTLVFAKTIGDSFRVYPKIVM